MAQVSGVSLHAPHAPAPHTSPRLSYERPATAEAPSPPTLPSTSIVIKHPGYKEQFNLLMQFHGFDRLGQQEGIHHGTVLAACFIVTGCDNGFLTSVKGGAGIGLGDDGLLCPGSYYFTVPNDDQYPIYPSFSYWSFPHSRLPPGWAFSLRTRHTSSPAPAHSNITSAVLARDQQCLVSGYKDIMERAHLCPQQEMVWFRSNNMRQYNQSYHLSPDCTTDDMSNLIALREDIHTAFDRRRMFAIVAKHGGWMIHFLQPSHSLGPLYHNIKVKLDDEVAPEHVFTRFAWAIFPLVRPFLQQGPKRSIRAWVMDDNGYSVEKNAIMDGDAIRTRFFPRSKSSNKRNRTDDEDMAEGEERGMKSSSYKRLKVADGWDNEAKNASRLHRENQDDTSQSHGDGPSLPPPSATEEALETSVAEIPQKTIRTPIDNCDNGINDPDPRIRQLYYGESDLDRLRRLELKRRRPYYNPSLFCCDYNRRTAVVHTAIKGEGDFDEYQLCGECLGGEYLP
ncbi:MAG: hypothetical protein Q9170_008346 [Blastenia crenularia]